MSKSRISQIANILLTAALALALVFGYDVGVIQPRTEPGTPRGTTNLDTLALTTLTATTVTGTGVSGTSYVVSNGSITAGTYFRNLIGAEITVTDGMTITPVSSIQPLTSAGNVGTSAIAINSSGIILRLYNTGSNTITITDTGNLKLSGNIGLGQYDSLTLISDGTNWIQTDTSNN